MSNAFNESELMHIKKHIEIFHKVSNINCSLIDDMGNTVLSEGESFHFCNIFKKETGENCPCNSAHLYGSKEAEKLGEAYIFFCPGGLVHFSAAIVIGEVFRGALIAGPIQMNISDPFIIDNLIKVYDLPMSLRGILQLNYKMIPLIAPDQVRYLSDLLHILTKDIMGDQSQSLEKKKAFYLEQKIINENIQEIKESTEVTFKTYPIELEKQLSGKIRVGDLQGAKAILNEILGYIMFKHGGDKALVISLIIELVVVMSRAAVDGGGNFEDIIAHNVNFYETASSVNDIEELCVWIVDVLEKFTTFVFKLDQDNVDNVQIINKALQYINNNYNTSISLEEIASHVGLSPTYFSRFFRKETNMKFCDYLNMVRVEESKKYLLDIHYSISDIAIMVGFNDQSYFTKVFKNFEKLSPGKYRKMYL